VQEYRQPQLTLGPKLMPIMSIRKTRNDTRKIKLGTAERAGTNMFFGTIAQQTTIIDRTFA
jgi:hypothetical protein